jgi:hypothetical protein
MVDTEVFLKNTVSVPTISILVQYTHRIFNLRASPKNPTEEGKDLYGTQFSNTTH